MTSENMFNIALILSSISSEDTFKTPIAVKLVNHIWKKKKSVIIILGSYYSIVMILFSIYIGLMERNLALEIVLICFGILSLMVKPYKYIISEKNTSQASSTPLTYSIRC